MPAASSFSNATGEALVGGEHLGGVGILERDHEAGEAEVVHELAMVERRLHDRLELIAGVAFEECGRDRAAVHPDADRDVGVLGDRHQPRDLVGHRLVALDVMQMAGVVANLVDMRGDGGGQSVVLLQIDHQRRRGLPPDFLHRGDFPFVVDGDPYDPGAGAAQLLALRDGGIDVPCLGRAHALHDQRRIAADARVADRDGAGGTMIERV